MLGVCPVESHPILLGTLVLVLGAHQVIDLIIGLSNVVADEPARQGLRIQSELVSSARARGFALAIRNPIRECSRYCESNQLICRPSDHLRSNRVQVNVAHKLGEVLIALAEYRLVTSLQQMPRLSVLAIVIMNRIRKLSINHGRTACCRRHSSDSLVYHSGNIALT
jgi:hypothetical protein